VVHAGRSIETQAEDKKGKISGPTRDVLRNSSGTGVNEKKGEKVGGTRDASSSTDSGFC